MKLHSKDRMESKLWQKLCESPAYRELLTNADVILGVFGPGNESVFYGRDRLKQIAEGDKPVTLKVARVLIDERTEDIEVLCAFCLTQKGKDEYISGSGSAYIA